MSIMLKKPNAVKNLKCVAMDLVKGFVVTWDCSNGATSYIIERKRVTTGIDKTEQTFNISADEYRKGNKIIFNSRANQYYVYYQKTSSKTTLITKVASTSAILKRASIEGGFVYVEPANGWGESKGAIRLWLAIDGKKVSAFTK